MVALYRPGHSLSADLEQLADCLLAYRDAVGASRIALKLLDEGLRTPARNLMKRIAVDFCSASDPKARRAAAISLNNLGATTDSSIDGEDGIQYFRRADEIFGSDEAPQVRELVASSLLNLGISLETRGQISEAIDCYRSIDQRYGQDAEAGVRESVAGAVMNLGSILGAQGRSEEAVSVIRNLIQRFGDDGNPFVRERLAGSMVNLAIALENQGRRSSQTQYLRKWRIALAGTIQLACAKQLQSLFIFEAYCRNGSGKGTRPRSSSKIWLRNSTETSPLPLGSKFRKPSSIWGTSQGSEATLTPRSSVIAILKSDSRRTPSRQSVFRLPKRWCLELLVLARVVVKRMRLL